MCGGGSDKAAKEARAREEERQQKITQGQGYINTAFSGFNDDFYNTRRQEYLDFVQPDFQDQYDKAREQLIFALSRGPGTASTVGAQKLNELKDKYNQNEIQLNRQADQLVTGLRTDVADTRGQLISQLSATADPTTANQQSLQRAQLLSAPGVYEPLGDLFAGIADLGSEAIQRQTNYGGVTGGLFQDAGGGSARVVR